MMRDFDSKRVRAFESYVLCFAVVQILHLISLIANLNTPLGLLYGPLLYCMYASLVRESRYSVRGFLLQTFPFVLFFIWYLFTYFLPATFYFTWIFPAMVASSLTYCVLIFFKMQGRFLAENNEYVLLVKQLSGLGITISLFLFLFYIDHYSEINLRIETIFTLSLSLFFCVFIAFHFLYLQWTGRKRNVPLPANVQEEEVDALVPFYGQKLQQAMLEQKLYLNPNLSLSELSTLTEIPKSEISDFINNYEKSNYYEWLASYRINYALGLMENTMHQLKMEAVASASGFNSKTVFYRYFKQYVGESPSAYRSKLLAS